MDTKKVLKNIGKIALTIVSPPIGLATCRRGKLLVGYGLVISAVLSGIQPMFDSFSEIYNKPQVKVYRSPTSFRCIPEIALSPIVYYFDREYVTTIVTDDKRIYCIAGDKVIQHNSQTGRYEAIFQEDNRFGQSRFSMSSLSEAGKSLEQSLASGDIQALRPSLESYEAKRSQYEETKKTLDSVVKKMNEELEAQRSRAKGERK